MANKSDIEINLKTIAKTGDLADLIAYIHKLGKSLREVGTEDAKALRDQLAAALKSIPKDATADQVKALVPDIGKVNALGALSGIDRRLAQFGTAQAKAVQQTVKEMRGAISGGALSDETIEMLSASLQKFVEQANRLPPAGLKKLAADIQKTIANTQELQEVIAEANDIEFNVRTDGTGSLGELQHKIEVIAKAKNLDDGIKGLNAALLTLDSKEADAVREQLERIKKILEGELGPKQVKQLKEEMKGLANVSSNLSSRELQRVGGALNDVQAQGRALGDEMRRTGNSITDEVADASTAVDLFGISIGKAEKIVGALALAIPKVGKALLAIPAMWLLAAIAIIGKGISGIFETFQRIHKENDEIRFSNAENNLKSITESSERWNDLLDITISKENQITEAIREQEDAQTNLLKAEIELERQRAKQGIDSDTVLAEIDRRYDERLMDIDAGVANRGVDREEIDIRRKLDAANRKRDRLEKDRKSYEGEASQYGAIAADEYEQVDGSSYWDRLRKNTGPTGFNLFRVFDRNFWTGHDPQEEGDRYARLATEAQSKARDALKERIKAQTEVDELEKKLASIEKKRKTVETENESKRTEDAEKKRQEQRRIDNVLLRRAREEELHEYDRDLAETNYQRNRRSMWQNDVEQLAEAEKMLERYRREEKDALDERERVMKEVAAQGGWQTITEKQEFRFNNATSDLARARSSRYQEQSTVDQLEKSLHDRRFEESERRYAIDREDSDAAWSRAYGRANYAQRLAMDRRRLAAAQMEYDAADAAILDDNSGAKTLTPEERRVMERRRNEARSRIVQSRESIAGAEYEGDTQRAQFYASVSRQGNRLTAMGLGGDVANWDKQTAANTRRIHATNVEMLKEFRNFGRKGGAIAPGSVGMTWGN